MIEQPTLGFWSALGCATFQHGVGGGAEIGAGRRAASWSGVVELAAINEPTILIEQEEIRRAFGPVSARGGLRFVIEIGKREMMMQCKARHFIGRVLGMRGCVVGADGDQGEPLGLILVGEGSQGIRDVNHVRAMIADEGHDKRPLADGLAQFPHVAARIRQHEIRRDGAEFHHARLCRHVRPPQRAFSALRSRCK